MGRIAAFEGLRGIMAGWVMLFHIAAFSAMPFANAMHSGVPVDVFILISGFVITHLVNSRSEAYGQFILRRFMRLYPIYLVALLVAVGLTDVYRYLIFDSSLAPFMETQQIRQEDVDRNFILHILLHLTMMHGVLPDQVLPASSLALLSPAWSITLEWQFYLIAPFLLARIRGRRAFLVAFALAYLGFWIVRLSGLDFGKPSFLLQRLPHFLVGIGAYLFYFKLLQDGRATRLMWRRMILWGSIAALALASFAVVLGRRLISSGTRSSRPRA
ncbi:acyltransferase [Tistrella mobilis]|uniref:acyltransferase family protein n=1 Tax=Tistrella mobilis TaxID=171437 RepID=UPI00355807EB